MEPEIKKDVGVAEKGRLNEMEENEIEEMKTEDEVK